MKESPYVNTKFDPDEKQKLREHAAKKGKSMGAIIREVIRKLLGIKQ